MMQSIQPPEAEAWFCLISQPKHEHTAAAQLARDQAVKVFAPRIRFRQRMRQSTRWMTEALFPGYFFAKFDLSSLRRVHYAPQVRGIVHFGDSWPTIPDGTIEELEKQLGGSEKVHTIAASVVEGDEVEIIEGTLQGFQAIVTQVMPARQRVAILMDFLGRQTVVQINPQALLKNAQQRESLFKAA
jgi:transcriptional antiterminator RfaH